MTDTVPEKAGKGFIIAIDGPVASGKGTIAPALAHKLNGFYLYSGAVFRCIGLACIESGISTKNEEGVSTIAAGLTVELDGKHIFLNGRDVTDRVKQEDVAMASSDVGVFKDVRKAMVGIMREIAHQKTASGIPVITEGRDMATSVFPDAEIKIFLTAKPEIRAKRRLNQIHGRGEAEVTFEQVLQDTIARDRQDSERIISPLVKDPEKFGYTVVDDSALSEAQTEAAILDALRKKKVYNEEL